MTGAPLRDYLYGQTAMVSIAGAVVIVASSLYILRRGAVRDQP